MISRLRSWTRRRGLAAAKEVEVPKAPSRDAKSVEEVGMGSEYPLPSRLGDLGNVVSGVRVGTPAEKDFRKI